MPTTTGTMDESLLKTSSDAETEEKPVVARGEDGRFVPGVSGNPKGRPKGSKNRITELKMTMEQALRENLDANDVQNVINAMLKEALAGNVSAGKLILDKVLSNAKMEEDPEAKDSGLRVIIEHAQVSFDGKEPRTTIDITPEEVSHVEKE